MRKRMRLPNGFGRITKISGKRLRKPYRAMITSHKDQFGNPVGKILGYYETYNDAYEALLEYNKNPYDLGANIMLVKDLYEVWSKWYFDKLGADSSRRTVESAWSRCKDVENIRVKDLRSRHIKGIIEACESPNIKTRIKSLFNLMLDYALEYEIVDKNYARDFKISDEIRKEVDKQKKDHIAFTEEEIKILWDNKDMPFVDMILVNIYSGWRPQELCNITWDDEYMYGGMKTEAGENRKVPIINLIKNFLNNYNNKYFCENGKNKLSYYAYRTRFKAVLEALGLNPDHRPHDARKTFITLCKASGVDEYAIKYMVGHKISDLTEKVYTERDPDWLKTEINKLL